MNIVEEFLRFHNALLSTGEREVPERTAGCLLLTPRFKASKHVIFLVFAPKVPIPVLVVKTPRLPGDCSGLDREARVLQALSELGELSGSVPQILTYESFKGHRFLVESFIDGAMMDRRMVRNDPEGCIERVLDWLIQTGQGSSRMRTSDLHRDPAVTQMKWTPEEEQVLEASHKHWEHASDVPLVLEHGDLSAPNILVKQGGSPAVIDWETGMDDGLPAVDLFFFLNFVASARRSATTVNAQLEAFSEAFLQKNSWSIPYVRRYARELDIPEIRLQSLFVLTWERYLIGIRKRLEISTRVQDSWLSTNRYYRFWRQAVEHCDRLPFTGE